MVQHSKTIALDLVKGGLVDGGHDQTTVLAEAILFRERIKCHAEICTGALSLEMQQLLQQSFSHELITPLNSAKALILSCLKLVE